MNIIADCCARLWVIITTINRYLWSLFEFKFYLVYPELWRDILPVEIKVLHVKLMGIILGILISWSIFLDI